MEQDFWKVKPILTPLSEEEIIQATLEYIVTKLPSENLMHFVDPGWLFGEENLNKFLKLAMHRMVSEGLITTEKSRQGRTAYVIHATAYGIRVAQYPGGYQAHLTAQRREAQQEYQAKAETERLNREAARATVDAASSARLSVDVSKRAVRVSWIGAIAASIIAIASIIVQVVMSNNTAADLALAQSQIKELQEQVKYLTSHK